MALLTSEPENHSVCVWFSNYTVLGYPIPTMIMVRIDEDSCTENRWHPADSYHSSPRFIIAPVTWQGALDRGKTFDGPYLITFTEEK